MLAKDLGKDDFQQAQRCLLSVSLGLLSYVYRSSHANAGILIYDREQFSCTFFLTIRDCGARESWNTCDYTQGAHTGEQERKRFSVFLSILPHFKHIIYIIIKITPLLLSLIFYKYNNQQLYSEYKANFILTMIASRFNTRSDRCAGYMGHPFRKSALLRL